MNAVSDLSGLPFPVAFPLYWARDPRASLGVETRRANAIFACYQALRLAALLMLADYLEVEESDPELSSRIRGLRVPHWQEWTLLADQLARFWSAEGRQPRFAKVVAGWMSVSRVKRSNRGKTPPLDAEWQELIKGFAGVGGKAGAASANEAVWELRNRRAHREGVTTPNSLREQGEELERLIALAEAIVSCLFEAPEFELLRAVNMHSGELKAIRLSGPQSLRSIDMTVSPLTVSPLKRVMASIQHFGLKNAAPGPDYRRRVGPLGKPKTATLRSTNDASSLPPEA